MKINKYKINTDSNGYVTKFEVNNNDYNFVGQMALYPHVCEGWTKFEDGKFIEDLEKKAEIEEERRKEAEKPTWEEKIESQVMWTALETDTLLESEEE